MNNNYKSFIRNYLLSTSLFDLVFAYAVYNLLFSLRGLSVFEISILIAFWALIATLLEIPTGALADRWNRKYMLVIAPLIKILCFVMWLFASNNIYLYALGFVFWALAGTFVSGTVEALLYDELVLFEKIEDYEKVLSQKKFYFHITLAFAMITGGFIANYNIDWTLIISIFPLLLSAFFASRIKQSPKVKSTEETRYLDHIRIAFHEVINNKTLLILFTYSFAISILGMLEEFDQLYYQLVGLPIFAFGLVGFSWSLLNAIGSFYAYKFKDITQVFYLFPFLAALALFFVGLYPSINAISVLLFAYFITAPLGVLVDSKIQHNIKSLSRATVTSTSALLINLFGAFVSIGFGTLASYYQLPAIYIATGIFLGLTALLAVINLRSISIRHTE